jgi:TonB-dependent starch-binding outer membrane protein SusC
MVSKTHNNERIPKGIKMSWRIPVLLLFMLMIHVMTHAQTSIKVSGVVKSASDGQPLPGVSVVIKGTTNGTITDGEGNFNLNVDQGSTLVFTFIGFVKEEIVIENGNPVKISLIPDLVGLDEVVVVGYGTMKRSDLTGAVSSVSESDIKKGVTTSLEQVLQGRIAGVQVTQNSGAPGGGVSVNVRGINSLNGNEPLYVIDGVAISGQTDENTSILATINPSDIVSMEVLKDASATAIYGSRASNGVILITTKKGETGKPKLTYEGYYAIQQLPNRLETMNLREYAKFYNERASIQGWGEREDFKDPSLLTEGTDWQKELFRNAPMHNHQLSITGGSKDMTYAISGGYLNQEGIALSSSFDRISFRVNTDNKITEWLTVGMNTSYANTKQVTTLDDAGLISTAINQRPDVPARNPDGSFGAIEKDDNNTYYSNPLAEALMRDNYNTSTQAIYNFYANAQIVKGLSLRLEYGGSLKYKNKYEFTPNYTYGTFIQEASSYRESGKDNYWSLKTYLTYDIKIAEKHSFQIMAGHEAQEGSWEYLSGRRTGYISNSVHDLDVGDASTSKNGNSSDSWAIESYYSRLNYNFNNRYLLTATIRGDGSSKFGPDNRWGFFPSAAFAWKINNESFMKDLTFINNFKLRLGWGIVGNQNSGSYAYGVKMANSETYWGTGYYPGNYGNPKLQWEETEAYNAGIDLALFENRIELIFDSYQKNTDNLLMQASLPGYIMDTEGIGMSAPWVNAGALENKGFELTLNTVNAHKNDFEWKMGISVSVNRNKLTKLYTNSSSIAGKIGDQVYTYSEINNPIGQFYAYNVIGMFTKEDDFYQKDASGNFLTDENGDRIRVALPENSGTGEPYGIAEDQVWVGDYIFEDVNKDGKINEKDRKYLGNPNPKFSFGFNNSFSYKNFDLNIFLNGTYDNKVYNYLRQTHSGTSGYSGLLKEVSNYAKIEKIDPAGDNSISNVYISNASTAESERINQNGGGINNNNRVSSRFIENGSYLRIKNISLGYTIPQHLIEIAHIDYLRIYFNVQNAFTFTKYKGYDPEVGSYGQSAICSGIDYARYPSQRIYTFGINLNF